MQIPSFLPTSSLTAHHNTKNIYIIWLQEYSTETIAEWLHKIYILKMIPNMMLMQVVPLYARYDATPLSQLHLKNFPFPSPFFFKMAGILHEWEDQTSHRGTKLMQAWLLRLHRASSRFCSWCAWHDVKHDACCQEEWMMRGVRVHMSTSESRAHKGCSTVLPQNVCSSSHLSVQWPNTVQQKQQKKKETCKWSWRLVMIHNNGNC